MDDGKIYTDAITKNRDGKIIFKKNHQNLSNGEDDPIDIVLIGEKHQPIHVPSNATMTVPGKVSKLNQKGVIPYCISCHITIYHLAL